MASRKGDKSEDSSTRSESTNEATRNIESLQRQQQETVRRSLDESKANVRRALREAEEEIPKYTEVVRDYQTKTIETSRDIAESYLDSQRRAIESIQSNWEQNMRQMESWWGFPISPGRIADVYSRMTSVLADGSIASSRIANKTIFANMEAAAITMDQARDSAREMARISNNLFDNIDRTSKEETDRQRNEGVHGSTGNR
jgi:hypothetical protein